MSDCSFYSSDGETKYESDDHKKVDTKKRPTYLSEDSDVDKKRKKAHSSDEEVDRKRKRFVKKKDEGKRRDEKRKREEKREEKPVKRPRNNSRRDSSDDEKKKDKKKIDFDLLESFAKNAFIGQTKEIYPNDVDLDKGNIKGILNTLMDEYRSCSDALAMVDYIKCVLILSEIWLHRRPFAMEGEFHECLDGIKITREDKWNWPCLSIEKITIEVFNQCCELIYSTLTGPAKYQVPFQEFVSLHGAEHGMENLLPLTNLSKKTGTRLEKSAAVHMGLGIAGNYMMVAKNVQQKTYDLVFTDVNMSKVSEVFTGAPPVKIHFGSLKSIGTRGKINSGILVLGSFAEIQCVQGNSKTVNLRARTLMSMKIGESPNCDTRFMDRL